MASIREVAKIAGVSPSTVSRVMNGTAKVEEDKRQRVLKAIEETGFKPNELARALFKKSSKIIGVIVPTIENPYFNELARVIEEEAYQHGYKILLCNSNENVEKEKMNIQMLSQMNADGLIIMTFTGKIGKIIENCEMPVVVVDRLMVGNEGIAFIESDNYSGGVIATEHLIKCGCKNIVCMQGPQDLSSGEKRYQGYKDVCRKYGLPERTIPCGYSYENGLEATPLLLKMYPEVDGIVASNDMVAMSAYKILAGKGYRVPEDIQLIGFDDIRFSKLFTPEITTIGQQIPEMGKKALQLIIAHINGEKVERQNIFPVTLIERETTRK